MGIHYREGVGSDEAAVLKRWPREAEKLPPHGETWMRAGIELDHGALNAFNRAGVIKKRHRNQGENDAWNWETAQHVVEWVDKHIADATTPCGRATGIRTITAGEEYTCSNPECDCRMDRETAAGVVP